MAGQALATCAMLKVARGGTAARDASDVAVKPTGLPSEPSAVTAATPAAWRRKTRLKASRSSTATSWGSCAESFVLMCLIQVCPAGAYSAKRMVPGGSVAWSGHDEDPRPPQYAAHQGRTCPTGAP